MVEVGDCPAPSLSSLLLSLPAVDESTEANHGIRLASLLLKARNYAATPRELRGGVMAADFAT